MPSWCGVGGFEAESDHAEVVGVHEFGDLGGEQSAVQAVGGVELEGEVEFGGFFEDGDEVAFGVGEEGIIHEGDVKGFVGWEQG